MTSKLLTITDAIRDMGVASGVQVRDVTGIPQSVSERDCPLMYPRPEQIVQNMAITPQTFGSGEGSGRAMDVTYTLTYRMLYSPLGAGRGLFDNYAKCIDLMVTIFNKLAENDAITGAVDVKPRIVSVGPMPDPAGNQFHGVEFALDILEFYEV